MYYVIETQVWSWIGVYSTARLTTIYLEDFFLTSQFPDFLTPPVGGFINNVLGGLLRINYELCTYNAALHNVLYIRWDT
jgi:hypothetical protein